MVKPIPRGKDSERSRGGETVLGRIIEPIYSLEPWQRGLWDVFFLEFPMGNQLPRRKPTPVTTSW